MQVEPTSQNSPNQPGFFKELRRELREVAQSAADAWAALGATLRNQMRLLRRARVDYVLIPIGGSLPERDAPPRGFIQRQLPLPEPPLSMETLNRRLCAIADAPNVKGVVFIFQGFEAGLATLQNFRRAVARLRAAGKEAIVYTPYLDLPHYFAATAANRLIAPPSAEFTVLGLRTEVTYLKDALTRAGLHVDIVQISPYKSAYNRLGYADMTPEEREQFTWLLDDQFDMLLASMAEGRGEAMTQDGLSELINQAPFFAAKAQQAGLVDCLGYEDDLPFLLAETAVSEDSTAAAQPESPAETSADAPPTTETPSSPRPKANLLPWHKAAPLLLEKRRRHTRKFIGVVSLEGSIVMGPSRTPPVDLPIPFIGGQLAGEQTLLHQLRQAEQNDSLAALIFHVDSPGGSALASDLIAREVARIALKKPVLAYMGNIAGSGGYYVSAPAQHIMCQGGTFTGSIGVINARVSTGELLHKLRLNQVHLERGEHAGLYSNNAPLSEEERRIFRESIEAIYAQFKEVVSNGRSLPIDELDPICEGRVWTGRQALTHKLVDGHGDFVDAIFQTAELAGLPVDDAHTITVHNFYPRDGGFLAAAPFEPAAWKEIGRFFLDESWRKLNGQSLLLMPFDVRIV